MISRHCRVRAVRVAAAAAFLALVLPRGPAGAENRIAVRGAYFREASTRVVQPMVEASLDLPQGFDVGGHLAVDAISSASIAQGAMSDEVFSEERYEGSLSVGKTLTEGLRVGLFGRYSREPDYFSTSAGLNASLELWERTGTIGFTVAHALDDIRPSGPIPPRELDVWFAGLSYAQVFGPTLLGQLSYEFFHLDGFYGNPYIQHPNYGRDVLPEVRIRHALTTKVAQYFPEQRLGLQLHYRFYFDQGAFTAIDPWGLTAHSIEGRVYKQVSQNLELRLSYRYHWQGDAEFWCNSRPDSGGTLDCYGLSTLLHSWDPKFGSLTTHLPELKVIWDLRALADIPVLRHLAGGALDVSYGYYFESAYYGQKFTDKTAPPIIGLPYTKRWGGAHVVQTGYVVSF